MKNAEKYERRHLRDIKSLERKVEQVFSTAAQEAALLGCSISGFNPDKPFSFSDYPATRKRLESLLSELRDSLSGTILNGIDAEWKLANEKNDELSRQVFGDNAHRLTPAEKRHYFGKNEEACSAFKERTYRGMNLSDRVWNYTNQFKTEIEFGLDLGLRDGLSADEMSRNLRQYLKYPDKLFRRVRDTHGQLQLSKAAKAFHPGQGVYRSSYKNARRLAATEVNIAYMSSDYLRWQQLDFVVGIEIKLSNNHTLNGQPFYDICDELKGKYPKDFKFVGFHPLCRCHVETILKTEEETAEDIRRIMSGEEPVHGSMNEVKDVPDSFKQWLEDNEERAKRMSSVPYFIRDNVKFIPERFIQNMGTLKGGQDAGIIENLKEAFLKLKDPNYITNKEVQDTIKTFAQNNPDLFLGGLTDVEITRTKSFFMANHRSYLPYTRAYDMAGNTIKIANRKFWLVGGETFNPLEEVKGALKAISTGVDMTFKQEYALESLWHEIRHAQAVGWKSLRNKTPLKRDSMETINQFCARHSYRGFVKSLGGKTVHAKEIIEQGYGYGRFVSNFQNLLKHINVTQAEAYVHFKDIILKTPYEEIYGEIVKFVQAKAKCGIRDAYDIVENMVKKESTDFVNHLQQIK